MSKTADDAVAGAKTELENHKARLFDTLRIEATRLAQEQLDSDELSRIIDESEEQLRGGAHDLGDINGLNEEIGRWHDWVNALEEEHSKDEDFMQQIDATSKQVDEGDFILLMRSSLQLCALGQMTKLTSAMLEGLKAKPVAAERAVEDVEAENERAELLAKA